MSLDSIINVSLSVVGSTASQAGFGIPMVAAQHTHFAERWRSYTTLAGMVADGFVVDEPAHREATSILSQNPKVSSFLVGRLENDQKEKFTVTPIAVNSKLYTIYIDGQAASFTSDDTALVAEITAGLKITLDALSKNIVVTDNGTDLDIEAVAITDTFSLYVNNRDLFELQNVTPDLGGASGIVDDLTAIMTANNDWYEVTLANQGKAVIEAAAAYIETLSKIQIVSSCDEDILDSGSTTDVGYNLKNSSYARTALMYNPKSIFDYPGAGWAGRCLPKPAGSITWAYKLVSGSEATALTETEITTLEGKNVNYLMSYKDLPRTIGGIGADGTFLDITRSLDFLEARIQEGMWTLLATTDKVPYTDEGVTQVYNVLNGVLKSAADQGIISRDYVITVPAVADASDANKALRHLTMVSFAATLQGAIHTMAITGEIST